MDETREKCDVRDRASFLACGFVLFLSLVELNKPDRLNKPEKPAPATNDGGCEGREA